MNTEKAYVKLLKKMLIVENIGEDLYNALYSKARNKDIGKIYRKLAQNEFQTRKCIEEELSSEHNGKHIMGKSIIQSIMKVVFKVLSESQLRYFLKNTLKRKIYTQWFKKYKYRNEIFWESLLKHENLQHELLTPFWNQKEK